MANEKTSAKGASADRQPWLAPLASALGNEEPLLVLCRTEATIRAV